MPVGNQNNYGSLIHSHFITVCKEPTKYLPRHLNITSTQSFFFRVFVYFIHFFVVYIMFLFLSTQNFIKLYKKNNKINGKNQQLSFIFKET